MKAVQISKTGGPEVLEIKEITLDKPGADEVTIEHKAIGLNYIDTYHRSGLYPLKLPSGIGVEAAGIIKEIGSDVKEFSVGDKISYSGAPLGAYSTHRNYPTKNLVKVPNNIDLEIAATLMTKGLTTFYLLHKTYPVKTGQTILFHAAAGGVGQIFGQWAKSLGCKIIGTVGSDEKIDKAKSYGYDHVINYNKENFSDKVLEITNGKGLPVVYDGVGKNTFEDSLKCLTTRGMMVSFGNASGALSPIDVPKLLQPKGLYFVRPSMQQYLNTVEEIKQWTDIVYDSKVIEPKDKEFIRIAIDLMPDEPWDDDTWDKWTSAIKEKTNRKGKELFLPLREAFTGVSQGPEMKKLIQLIGRSKIIERVKL